MGLIVVGLSHQTAPIELREHLTVPSEQLEEVLNELKSFAAVKEAVVLSTCNRLEIFARPQSDRQETIDRIFRFFQDLYQHPQVEAALYYRSGFEAVLHLFRVACGLDSLVIGETEILGQVKSAYQFAHGQGTTGKITNVLFQRALFAGKMVRMKTEISDGASSVGNVAVQLAERIFGSLQNQRLLLLGAGKMAEVTARYLLRQKVGQIVILNRTFETAKELAELLNGEVRPMETLAEELLKADIVIASTAAEKPVVTKGMVQTVMKERRRKPLYFIDIAVPRNIDPQVHELDNVYVYNIDDLKGIVDENFRRRKEALTVAESLARGLAQELYDWVSKTLDGQRTALRHSLR